MNTKEDIFCFLYQNHLKINHDNDLLNDKNFIKKIIKINKANIKYVPKELMDDESFFLELCGIIFGNDYSHFYNLSFYQDEFLSNYAKKNSDFLLKIIKINPYFITSMEKELVSKKIAKESIRKDGCLICLLPKKYKTNKDLFLLSMKTINKRSYYYRNIINYIYINYKNNDLMNDFDIKFKVYNVLLKNGILNFNKIIYFKNIKPFDILEYIKYDNILTQDFEINNNKLINYMSLKIKNFSILLHLHKIKSIKTMIKFISNINFNKNTRSLPYFKTFINKISNKISNRNDFFIFFLKNITNNIYNLIPRDDILKNKELLKVLLIKKYPLYNNNLIYLLKYQYHVNKITKNDVKNINIVLNNSIRDKLTYDKNRYDFINEKNIDKKIMNKLMYYSYTHLKKNYLYHNDSLFFHHFSSKMKNDLKLIKLYCLNSPYNFIKFNYMFKMNKDEILYLIKEGCQILPYLSDYFRDDPEIVYFSLKLNIKLIIYANIRFINEYITQNFDLENTFKKYNF